MRTLLLMTILGSSLYAQESRSCSNATVKGTYGYTVNGTRPAGLVPGAPLVLDREFPFTNTEGDDSNNDRSALLQHLTGDRRVHIYTIALGGDADVSTLKRIASATNGAYYGATNPINIEGAFADALSNF